MYKALSFSELRDIYFLDIIDWENLPIPQVFNHIFVQSCLSTILFQPLPTIYTSIGQQYQVTLHMALCMMCVWNIPCQIVELRTAYGTNGGGDGRGRGG